MVVVSDCIVGVLLRVFFKIFVVVVFFFKKNVAEVMDGMVKVVSY